jgi:hypothetical protein
MELIRKFYIADPNGGTGGQQGPAGPSAQDVDNAEKLNKNYSEMQATLRSISSELLTRINGEIEDWDETSKSIVKSIGRDLNNEIKDSIKLTKSLADNEKGIGKSLTTQVKVKEQIRAVEKRRENVMNLIADLEAEGITITSQILRLQEDLTEQLNQQDDALQQQLKKLKAFEDRLGLLGGVLKGMSQIPVLGQFIKADKVIGAMTKELEAGGSKMKVFAAGAGAFLDGIASGLTGLIIPALKFIIDSVIQFNQKAFDIAKNLGVTVDEAQKIQNTFTQIASTSKNAALTGKDITKTYIELSNTVGYLLPQTKEFAETATLIQKRLGASAESMEALTLQSALSGKTLLQTMGTLNASRNIEGARSKILLSQKQILDGIAKTSAAVLINFKGNVAALGDAIVRATKLGTSLDTVNKQGSSLLDFESSISKEMEAQVLTGRDMNLTKARELALNGKTAELMEELNKQGATYKQFMSENVIAREADAAAIGLSVEEYSKILLKQQQANLLGAQQGQSAQERYNQLVKEGKTQADIARMLGSEQEAADLKKASMQEKFQAAVEKLKDTLGSVLAGPVGGLIDKFTQFVGDQKKMNYLAQTLKGVFEYISKTIEKFPQILSTAVSIMKVLVALSIARAVATIVASLSTVPVLGAVAGIAAGVSAYNWLDGLTSGAGGSAPSVQAPGAPDTGMAPMNYQAEQVKRETPAVKESTSNNNTNNGNGVGNVYLDNYKVGFVQKSAASQIFGG